MAEREVLIRYKVTEDRGNAAVYGAMGQAAVDTQSAFARAAQGISRRFTDGAQEAVKQWSRAVDLIQSRLSTIRPPAVAVPGVGPGVQTAFARAAAGGAGGVPTGAAAAAERQAQRAEQLAERQATVAERAAARAQAAQNRRTIDILRQQEKEAVSAERTADRTLRATERAQLQATRAAERETTARERLEARAAQQAAVRRGRFIEGGRRALGGAVAMAEGAAYLGLAGSEEDTEALLRRVVQIRGVASALVGTVELVDGLMKAFGAVRLVAIAGAGAETLLHHARAKTALATTAAAVAEGGRGGAGLLAGAGGMAAGRAGIGLGGLALRGLAVAGGVAMSTPVVAIEAILASLAAGGMATNAFGMRDWAAGKMSGATRTVDEFGVKGRVSNIGEYGENRSGWESFGGRANWLFTGRGFGKGRTAEDDAATAAMNRTKRLEAETSLRDSRRQIEAEAGRELAGLERQRRALEFQTGLRQTMSPYQAAQNRAMRFGVGAGFSQPEMLEHELTGEHRAVREVELARQKFEVEEKASRLQLETLREQDRLSKARGVGETVPAHEMVAAEERRIAALRQAVELTQRESEVRKNLTSLIAESTRRTMEGLRARQQAVGDEGTSLSDQYQEGAARWGALNPATRERIRQARSAFEDRGKRGQLRDEELSALEDLPGMRQRVLAERARRGEAEGWDAVGGNRIQQAIEAGGMVGERLQSRLDVKQQLLVTIQTNTGRIQETIEAKMGDMQSEIDELLTRELDRAALKIKQDVEARVSQLGAGVKKDATESRRNQAALAR